MIGGIFMSFVVFVGNQDFGLMLADKRTISYNDEIVNNDTNKIFRINSKVVMCTGGDSSIKQYVIDDINNQENSEKLSFDEVKYIVYKRLEEVNTYINNKGFKEMNSSIGIMGIKNDSIHFISMYISYNEIKTIEKIYLDGENGYCVVANGKTQLEKVFRQKIISILPCTMNDIIQLFSDILQEQADNDISINKKFDYDFIRNDKK